MGVPCRGHGAWSSRGHLQWLQVPLSLSGLLSDCVPPLQTAAAVRPRHGSGRHALAFGMVRFAGLSPPGWCFDYLLMWLFFLSRRIVNDTYRTDLCLLYPPFMIALGNWKWRLPLSYNCWSSLSFRLCCTYLVSPKKNFSLHSLSPACLHVACVVQQKDARQWFAELSVDMEKVRGLSSYVCTWQAAATFAWSNLHAHEQILEIIRVILKLYDQWKNFDDRKEMAAVLNKMPKPKPPPNRWAESLPSLVFPPRSL